MLACSCTFVPQASATATGREGGKGERGVGKAREIGTIERGASDLMSEMIDGRGRSVGWRALEHASASWCTTLGNNNPG